MTNKFSLTVRACEGRNAETVPAILRVCRIRVELARFFDNSCSSFLRIAFFHSCCCCCCCCGGGGGGGGGGVVVIYIYIYGVKLES